MAVLEKFLREGKLIKASELPDVQMLPLGNISMDYVLGGGLCKGLIYLVSGPPSSGKSSFAVATAQAVMNAGGKALVVDLEHAWLKPRLASWGLSSSDNLYIAQDIPNLESAYSLVVEGINEFDLVIVDSIGAICTIAEEKATVAERQYAPGVREVNNMLRKVLPKLKSQDAAALILISQIREVIGGAGGIRPVGGHALLHDAHVWLETRINSQLMLERDTPEGRVKEVVGLQLQLHTRKSKICPPFRRADVRLIIKPFKSLQPPCFDPYFDAFVWGQVCGLIVKTGSWFTIELDDKKEKFQGSEGIYGLDLQRLFQLREAIRERVLSCEA